MFRNDFADLLEHRASEISQPTTSDERPTTNHYQETPEQARPPTADPSENYIFACRLADIFEAPKSGGRGVGGWRGEGGQGK